MHIDYIIVGQGICGTLLSRELMLAGKKIMVIDKPGAQSPGQIASGLMNPVTGMRVAKSWMADVLLPFAADVYRSIEKETGTAILKACNVLEFHASRDAADLYEQRTKESSYLLPYTTNLSAYFNYNYGISEISPCYIVDMCTLQDAWRKKLLSEEILIEETFDWSACVLQGDKVQYKHITADRLICCDGPAGQTNPYFSLLPFSINKGEVLIAEIPDLPRDNVYKHGLKIAPWENGLFWIGSSFDWKYDDVSPTTKFRQNTELLLQQWLKMPYSIISHHAGLRPASVDHKPFVGLHPVHSNVGILNGMGAKGCSQAPLLAHNLAMHLCHNSPLIKEADVQRYKGILSRAIA